MKGIILKNVKENCQPSISSNSTEIKSLYYLAKTKTTK
jgi:hypothetical protein